MVLLLDDLDGLDLPEALDLKLDSFASPWPTNVRVLFTVSLTNTSKDFTALHRWPSGITRATLSPLSEQEATTLALAVWRRYHRVCPPDVIGIVKGIRSSNKLPSYENPLWLTLAMEEINLIDADDLEKIGQVTVDTPQDRLGKVLREIAKTLQALLRSYGSSYFAEWKGITEPPGFERSFCSYLRVVTVGERPIC